MPAQDTDFFGGIEGSKKVSDMISADTKILSDGTVTGTLYNVTGFTAFNQSDPDEQNGHFFPFTLTGAAGSKMTLKKNGADSKKDIAYDKDLIFRVDNNQTTFEVLVDDKPVIALNFEKATLQK